MGQVRRLRRAAALAFIATLVVAAPAPAAPQGSVTNDRKLKADGDAAEARDEMTRAAEEYQAMRIAPGTSVDPRALSTARAAAATLPTLGGPWTELTTRPYDSDDPNYRDPVWSNSGGGAGLSSGRMTAVATDPRNARTVYAGAADGGVWKSTDAGATWAPVFDGQASLAIGALAVNPADGSIWAGTGENNTAFENYAGQGVLRSTNGGASWSSVGGDFAGKTVGDIVFDGAGGVYVGTNFGLYKGTASGSGFTKVLDAPKAGFAPAPYGMSIVNSVAVRPGTGGKVVVANMAWRNGAAYNGFYISRDGGQSFQLGALKGAINPKAVGRATLAYAADGSKLYTVVEDTVLFNKPNIQTANTVLMGVFVSNTGDPAGSWNQIADYRKLANSGSALKLSKGYSPGVQAWYNQFLTVDPANANHVYLGLEEVFETRNGGSSWNTIGPYWNFGLPCFQQGGPESCPKTVHADQHAVAIAGGRVFVGDDGGMYSRSLTADPSTPAGWSNLNRSLRTLQYYYAGIGKMGAGDAIWGGLQDNGTSLLRPDPASPMVEPFGGDGGDVLVDPSDANRAVVEYTGLDMALTTNGGVDPNYSQPASFTEITPACATFTYAPRPDCDQNPRFISPFRADASNVNRWIAGGQKVWDNGGAGWSTRVNTWTPVYDTGDGNSTTAIAVNGKTIFAGWCGPSGCNPQTASETGEGFVRGIASNYGGSWHELPMAGLPNRYVNSLVLDRSDPAHVYAVFGGYSRRWIPNAGVGHVFESKDGGATWADISGSLPDAPADDLLLTTTKLVLGTDVGVFVADRTAPSVWSRLGTGLPNSAVNDLTPSPAGAYFVAATHGRGLWRAPTP